MRWIAVVLALTVATVAFAEEPQKSETTYKVGIDAESVDEVAQALERYVDGPLHTYYESAVRKNQVVPLAQLPGVLLLLVAAYVLFRRAWDIKIDSKTSYSEAEPWFIAVMVVGLLGFLFGAMWFIEAMPRLMVPEYYAIQDILQNMPH